MEQNNRQLLDSKGRPVEGTHNIKLATDFAYMCKWTTRGYLDIALFPSDYDDLADFERAFRDVAARFGYHERTKLREIFTQQGTDEAAVEKRITVRFLSAVMDECERRGFRWPSSILFVKSKLQREVEESKEGSQER